MAKAANRRAQSLSFSFMEEPAAPETPPNKPLRKRSEVKPPSRSSAREFQQLVAKTNARIQRRPYTKGSKASIGATVFERTTTEARYMLDSGNWAGAESRHFVAAYDILHLECYGVEATDLGPRERYTASRTVLLFAEREFEGDVAEVARYLLWVWDREKHLEKRAADMGTTRSYRLRVWNIFGKNSTLLPDYRLYLARRSIRR